MLAVPVEVVGLVAWKIDKALLIDLRLEILLVSLVCFNSSEGFKVMMMILMSKAKIAITMSNSIKVNDLNEPACRQAGVKLFWFFDNLNFDICILHSFMLT